MLWLQHVLRGALGRVRHSVAIYGQLLLFCDQSMREKAWRCRKRRTLLAGAAGELAGVTCLRQARPTSACTFSGVARACIVHDTGSVFYRGWLLLPPQQERVDSQPLIILAHAVAGESSCLIVILFVQAACGGSALDG
jgi:hypothetical protein